MIIELLGMPGAGKTTLAQRIEDSTDFKIIRIKNKKELLKYNLIYLIKHPIKFIVTLYYIITNSDSWKMFYYKFTNLFLHHNAKYQKALSHEKAIIDQGYFQNFLAVFEKLLSSREMFRYLGNLLYPDILFFVDVDDDVAKKRLLNRPHRVRGNFDPEYVNNWKKIVSSNAQLLKNQLSQVKIKSFIINGNKTTDEITKELEGIIK